MLTVMSSITEDPATRPPSYPATEAGSGSQWALGIGLIVVTIFAAIAMIVAVVVAKGGSQAAGSSVSTSSPGTAVTLSEFAINPIMVSATTTGGIDITNTGTVAHDLAVQDTDLVSPSIAPGESGHLDLSTLVPGTYTLYCQLTGHAEAGMKAMLHLSAGDGTASDGNATGAAQPR